MAAPTSHRARFWNATATLTLLIWFPEIAAGDTFRFLGQNDQNWGNGLSWEFGAAPPANGGTGVSDVLVRGAGGTARFHDFFDDPLEWRIRSLTFESQATGGWNHIGGKLFVNTITNNDGNTHSFGNSQVGMNGITSTIAAMSGNLDFNAQVFLEGSNSTLNVNGGQSVFFDGGISGLGFATPTSTMNVFGGTFVRLAAAPTPFDTINLTDGTLQLTAASVLFSGANLSVGAAATLDLNSNSQDLNQLTGSGDVTLGSATLTLGDTSNFTFSGVISGSGGLTKNQAGILTLGGDNSYTGATSITSGTLRLNNSTADGGLSSASDVAVSSGATFDLNGVTDTVDSISGNGTILLGGGVLTVNENSGIRTFGGAIQESGELQKSGGGTLVLSGTNTLTLIDINNGVLEVASQANLGTGTIELSGGELHATASFTVTSAIDANGSGAIDVDTGAVVTQSGVVSGSGSLTKIGNGTLTLSAANTYGGGTNVNDGTLRLSAANRIPNASDVALAPGATLNLNGFDETVNTISGTGGTISLATGDLTVQGSSGSQTFGGVITGTGSFNKQGAHTLILSGVHSYAGATTITGGTLQFASSGSLSSSTDVTISSPGIWDLNGIADTVNSISGNGFIELGTATLTVNEAGGSRTFGGSISGIGGNLVKSGTHTLVLSGTNNYSGTTTIDDGILQVGSDSNLGTGSLIFDSGTLATTGTFLSSRSSIINTTDTAVFDVAAGTTLTHAGTISGDITTMLVKQGTGTLRWTGSFGAPFLGVTHISAGTLDLGVSAAQTLVLPSAVVGVSGNLVKSDVGVLALGASNSYGGATHVMGGTLLLGSPNGRLPDTTDVAISAGAILDLNGVSDVVDSVSGGGSLSLGGGGLTVVETSGTRTLSGPISESGSITKSGGHTWVLSGANTFTGNIMVIGGVLSVGNNGNLGNAANDLTLDGTTLQTTGSFSAARDFNLSASGGTMDVTTGQISLSGIISGSGQFQKMGNGSLILTGANTFSGGTLITGGEIAIPTPSQLGVVTTNVTLSSGTMRATDTYMNTHPIVISGAGTVSVDTGFTMTHPLGISGAGLFTKSGGGTMLLSVPATHAGNTLITSGTLQFGSGGLPDAFDVTVNAPGIWNLNGVSDTIDAILGDGTIQLGGGSMTIGSANGGGAYSGTIEGPGRLVKLGSGRQILGGVNSHTISTDLNGGSLEVAKDHSLGAAAADLNFNGGTLNATATFATPRDIVLNSAGGSFNVGSAATLALTGAITGSGTLSKLGTGTLVLPVGTNLPGSLNALGGTVQIPSVTTIHGLSGSASLDLSLNELIVEVSGNQLFSGNIRGAGGKFTKDGPGIMTLSGINTYTGGTCILGGVLRISATDNLGQEGTLITFDGGVLNTTASAAMIRGIALNSGGGTIEVNASTTLDASGNVTGIGSLTKTSAGTLALSGFSTYTGGTNIFGGELSINNNVNLGAAQGLLAFDAGVLHTSNNVTMNRGTTLGPGGGVIRTDAFTTLTHGGVISGSFGTSTLTKRGPGTFRLQGINDYAGNTILEDGRLQVDASSQLGSAANVIQVRGGTLNTLASFTNGRGIALEAGLTTNTIDVASGTTLTQSGIIHDAGFIPPQSLTKAGAGTLVLTAANTFTSATNVQQGILRQSGGGRLSDVTDVTVALDGRWDLDGISDAIDELGGSGDVTLGSGVLTIGAGNGGATFGGVISGSGGLVKIGIGKEILTTRIDGMSNQVPNSYSGGTQINGGILNVELDGNLGAASGPLSFDGGELEVELRGQGGSLNTSRLITLHAGGGTIDTIGFGAASATLEGGVSGPGSLTKQGAGTLTLAAANVYAGATIVSGGLLRLQGAGRLPDVSRVQVDVASTMSEPRGLDLNNISDSINGLDGIGEVKLGTATLSIGTAGGNGSFSGQINGTGGLIKVGAGTQILSGNNTYSAGTQLNGGVLQVAANIHLGNSAGPLVFDGGMLRTTSSFSTSRTTTLNAAGGSLDVAPATTLSFNGTSSGSGGITKLGGGTLIVGGLQNYTGPTVVAAGSLRMAGVERLSDQTDVTVASGAMLDLDSFNESFDTLAGGGLVALGSAQLVIGLDNGSATFSGILNGTGDLLKEGIGQQHLTGQNTYSGATFVDRGELVLSGGGRINQSTAIVGFNIGSNGIATANGSGTRWDLSGNLQIGLDGTGRMNIVDGAAVSVDGGVVIGTTNQGPASVGTLSLSGGLLDNSLGSGIHVVNGTLQGHGTILGNIDNLAHVTPGTSAGILDVMGNFIQASSGALAFEIGGRNNSDPQAPQFDELNVSGNLALDGLLDISLLSGFNPLPTDTFSILDAGFLTGIFSNVANGGRLDLTAGGNGSFRVNYGTGSPFAGNSVVLSDFQGTASASGDFNGDGIFNCLDVDALVAHIATGGSNVAFDLSGDGLVDQTDLTQWRTIAGAINLPAGNPYRVADANLDGVVDGSDFGIWNSNKFTTTAAWCRGDFNADGVVDGSDFGLWNSNKFTSSDASRSVPEPSWVVMLVLGLYAFLGFRTAYAGRREGS